MKKLLVLFLVGIFVLTLIGCGEALETYEPDEVVGENPVNHETEAGDYNGASDQLEPDDEPIQPVNNVIYPENPIQDISWISPPKVHIGNFRAGATAEWTVLVHNGDSVAVERKEVTSGTNDPTVDMTLGQSLYNDDVSNIVLISDCVADRLNITSYNPYGRVLQVTGLADNTVRIIEVRYPIVSKFQVQFQVPDNVDAGWAKAPVIARSWVTIAESQPMLAPFETREVLVTLTMPSDAVKFAPKWEFWITATNMSQGGHVHVVLASRWLVTMQ